MIFEPQPLLLSRSSANHSFRRHSCMSHSHSRSREHLQAELRLRSHSRATTTFARGRICESPQPSNLVPSGTHEILQLYSSISHRIRSQLERKDTTRIIFCNRCVVTFRFWLQSHHISTRGHRHETQQSRYHPTIPRAISEQLLFQCSSALATLSALCLEYTKYLCGGTK